ncbi:hypothetical protein F53441_2018 [Fusarium austroafricanum]|uniref:Uncharacterized protein n=1 Tax=Fusarium austroafricanum TaxID=2364996 RepID=A0A8H4KU41_9HYPO|nr:hypothetical protein F53441_2018 [Fusarium austroafricanum]
MNWTEGALARHSRRKGWDKDAARQKQYFAKARARKNGPPSSKGQDVASFVPDYIPQPPPSQSCHSVSSTPAWKQRTPRGKLIHKQSDSTKPGRKNHMRYDDLRLGKQGVEAEHSSTLSPDKDRQELDIATKRRKLLEKADWTGVVTQKPVSLDFSWQKDRSARPLTKSNSRNDHQLSSGHGQKDRHNKRILGRLSKNEMEIHIGSQNLRWSRDSNSVRSFATRQDLVSGLDNPLSTNTTRQALVSPYQKSPSVRGPRESSPLFLSSESSRNQTKLRNSFLSLSSTAHPTDQHAEQEGGRLRAADEPRYVVRDHTPVIHQPQPTRETRHHMLSIRSPELEEDASIVAVLGTPRHSYSRITAEDIRWNMWLNSNTKSTQEKSGQASQGKKLSRSISPGISNYWNTSEDKLYTQSLIHCEIPRQNSVRLNADPQLRSPGTYASSIPTSDNYQYGALDVEPELPELQTGDRLSSIQAQTSPCVLPRSPGHERSESSIKPGSDLVLPIGTGLLANPKVQDLLDLLTASDEQLEPTLESQTHQDTPPDSEDENEIWKRFVLDKDTVETGRKALEEAHEQTKCDLGLKKPNVPRVFMESSLTFGSTAPLSDMAEPSSASRGKSPPTIERDLNVADDQTEYLSGANCIVPSSEAAAMTNITDATDSIIAQPASPQPLQADFKFHQPQLFVGRLASDVPSNTSSIPFNAPLKEGRRQRSRRRRDKGRPDFRAMPNYNDDPIEEG